MLFYTTINRCSLSCPVAFSFYGKNTVINHLIIYANATGWSAITEIIALGEVEDNYLIRNRASTSGICVLLLYLTTFNQSVSFSIMLDFGRSRHIFDHFNSQNCLYIRLILTKHIYSYFRKSKQPCSYQLISRLLTIYFASVFEQQCSLKLIT